MSKIETCTSRSTIEARERERENSHNAAMPIDVTKKKKHKGRNAIQDIYMLSIVVLIFTAKASVWNSLPLSRVLFDQPLRRETRQYRSKSIAWNLHAYPTREASYEVDIRSSNHSVNLSHPFDYSITIVELLWINRWKRNKYFSFLSRLLRESSIF